MAVGLPELLLVLLFVMRVDVVLGTALLQVLPQNDVCVPGGFEERRIAVDVTGQRKKSSELSDTSLFFFERSKDV